MTERNFHRALRSADREIERVGLPPDVDARLRKRLRGDPRPAIPYWAVAAALAVGAASVLVVLLLPQRSPEGKPGGQITTATKLGGLTVLSRSTDLSAAVRGGGLVTITAGRVTLASPRWRGSIQVLGPGALRREPRGVRVVRGKVRVEVAKRSDPEPIRLLVSHGEIEVLGTQFEITQRESGGQVSLHEGRIRFVAADGLVRLLAPGDTLSWPLTEPAKTEPAKTEALPRPPPTRRARARRRPRLQRSPRRPLLPEVERLGRLLEQVSALRSRGRYLRVTQVLRAALAGRWTARNRERLSFELGSILTYHVRGARRACRWWRRHRRRFPKGLYTPEIGQAEAQLDCTEIARENR